MPAQQRLRHRVNRIAVGAVGERRALFEETVHPGEHLRMRDVDVPGLHQRTDRRCPADLSTDGFTGMMPEIRFISIWITADSLALSSFIVQQEM